MIARKVDISLITGGAQFILKLWGHGDNKGEGDS